MLSPRLFLRVKLKIREKARIRVLACVLVKTILYTYCVRWRWQFENDHGNGWWRLAPYDDVVDWGKPQSESNVHSSEFAVDVMIFHVAL